jgi:hypothetical protein
MIATLLSLVLLVPAPWLLAQCSLSTRLLVIATVGTVGFGVFCWFFFCLLRQRECLSLQRWGVVASRLLIFVPVSLWVSVLSYSAQVSILPTVLIYGACLVSVVVPLGFMELFVGLKGGRPFRLGHGTWVLVVLVFVSMLCARPGRRFYGGAEAASIVEVAATLATPREAVSWVHSCIVREKAPFTDSAVNTLERRKAKCGGQANVLDKILSAAGIQSRIVHLEDGKRIHTLVEYREVGGRWRLADPQHDIVLDDEAAVSGWDVLTKVDVGGIPVPWRGYSKLYIYEAWGGYFRVTSSNRDAVYARENE